MMESLMRDVRLFVLVTSIFLGATPLGAAPDMQSQRIRFEYENPSNPAHQSLYNLVRERRVLEKLQEIFSPFRLPIDLTFRTVGCDGRANAWYQRPAITLCYEYLDEISKNTPKETTPAGITPDDAVIGQFFYVVAHEFAHAVFDLLSVPSFGNAEERRLISGAAYSYRDALQNSTVILPLQAFSDVHGVPAQRFFNLLCVAYGADPQIFADAVQYLPKQRAADCKREYNQVGFAFQQLVQPHIDQDLAKRVMQRSWLPDVAPPPPRAP